MNSARGTGPVPGTENADPATAGRRPSGADAGAGRESDQLRRAADELAQRGRDGVGMTATTARFRQFELAQLLNSIAQAVEAGEVLPRELLRHAANLAQHILSYPPAAPAEAPATVPSSAVRSPGTDEGETRMQKSSLTALARQQLEHATNASSGRSSHTVYGGHEHVLRQTVIALAAGQMLSEHENPGEATVHVLHGRVKLAEGDTSWEGSPGDLLVVPAGRHTLEALEAAAVLLTVAKRQ